MPRKQMNLIFPGRGLDRSNPYERQPPYSTPNCQNVRLFETIEGRATGGSRPGISKAYTPKVGGDNRVNLLHTVVQNDQSGFVQYAENFNLTTLENNGWAPLASYSSDMPTIFDPASAAIAYTDITAKAGAMKDLLDPAIDETRPYTVEVEIVPFEGTFGGSYVLWAGADDTTPDPYDTGIVAELIMNDATDSYTGSLKHYSGGSLQNTYAFTPYVSTDLAKTDRLWFHLDGTAVSVYWGDTLLTAQTISLGSTNHRSGFGFDATVAGGATMISTYMVQYHSYDVLTTVERPKLVAGGDGEIWVETFEGSLVQVTTDLTINDTERVRATALSNKLYIADHGDIRADETDGTIAGDKLDSPSIADWTAISLNLNDYVVVLSNGTGAVVDGNYEIVDITIDNIVLSPTPGDGNCAFHIERGPKIYDPADDTLSLWVADEGAVPVGASLIDTYRGRIVMAVGRLWFMSRQFDALDWDYGADDTDYSRAVAGQNAEAGDIGQKLNALMPHHDDYLVFGCERSLWVLRGDPAWPGCTLGPISKTIGCVGGDAWTSTDDGAIVLLSHAGLFAIPAGGGGFPQPLSATLPRELKNLTKSLYQVSLEFEPYDKGVHVFVHQEGVQHTQWWMDWQTKALYPVELHVTHIPFCTYFYNNQVQDTSDVLIGCSDGSVRRFADRYSTDDGREIVSFVELGPIKLGNGYSKDGSLEEMVATLNYYSGSIDWSIRVGRTSQDALLADTIDSGTWDNEGGLQLTDRPRVRGESCIIRLENSDFRAWAMEDIAVLVEILDDQRML